MILSPQEAKNLTAKVLALSKADSAVVNLSGTEHGNIRFALNNVTTSGHRDDLSLGIESNFGKRSGSVTINELDDASILAAVRKSEEIARLAPENPEFMPPLGQQAYLEGRSFSAETAKAQPHTLAALCRPALQTAEKGQVNAAGYLSAGASFSALATSKGLFAYDDATEALFTMTARTPDGKGSGWAGRNSHVLGRLNTPQLGATAVEKARASHDPVSFEPGRYTVILESSAVSDLLETLLGSFDARSADEGRSFFTKKGGGNKQGEKVCGDNIHLFSDPQHDQAPGTIYTTDGLPAKKQVWIEGGFLKQMTYSRYWAQKQGQPMVPYPTNLIMTGGNTPIQQMIEDTKRGVLVTRIWYVREVDPRTLVQTGLTRDGTFLIENGRITRPIKNFRFNESPVSMLNNIVAMGPSERATGSESEEWPIFIPPLLVRDFTFSSISDAI
ncbi:MAG TPA: TldD/PmbA family protein [Candidatus Saccharimonadales bacterium]|nr:TldD/PmbA family protein [Candidatus Saccharimonadales bacterium]